MIITVYTGPNCMPCKLTKRALHNAGLSFCELPAHEHAVLLREMEYRELPIVVAGGQSWCGFRPDLIAEVRDAQQSA